MTGVLWQNSPQWGSLKLGMGASTIGRGGCLLTCLTEAARLLAGRPGLLPPHANEICKGAKAFQASLLILEPAAKALGLECPASERVDGKPGDSHLNDALLTALERGFAVIHVDHDGLDGGDHFILATGKSDGGNIVCRDPALATLVALQWPSLEAAVRWGQKPKTYRVVSVRPLRAQPV